MKRRSKLKPKAKAKTKPMISVDLIKSKQKGLGLVLYTHERDAKKALDLIFKSAESVIDQLRLRVMIKVLERGAAQMAVSK